MAGKVMSVEEAVALVADGATVACAGFIGAGHPEALAAGIEDRFRAEARPSDLTLVFASGQGDGTGRGLDHLAHPGLVKRVIGGHFGLCPKLASLIGEDQVEAYNFPTGVLSQLYRSIAAERPGVLTHIGLKTFVDPRRQGGRLNARRSEDLVELVRLRGQEWLLYHAFPINVALIRATTADERGNLTLEHEAQVGEVLALAQAARNSGGLVLAQVERVTAAGALDPRLVRVPGLLVDGVVIAPPDQHRQTLGEEFNPAYCGDVRAPAWRPPIGRLRARKIVARRAALELTRDVAINVAVETVPDLLEVAAEEGILGHLTFALQTGVVGGMPAAGASYGAACNPEALLDAPSQYDFLDGGGLDVAILGLGQVDAHGNVNVSRFGPKIVGCGAFINLSQTARQVILCGLFRGGAETAVVEGGLTIAREGEQPTFVNALEHITFCGEYAGGKGQRVLYVTERAVFELRAGSLVLTEIAPGIDLKRDVLAHMDFRPEIAAHLKRMDSAILTRGPMGLGARY
jgi:propionate CoA-transferase